jgi:hypothetical protein
MYFWIEMQKLESREQYIINRIRALKGICESSKDCKSCTGYDTELFKPLLYQFEKKIELSDFIGCPFTNYVMRLVEKYQRRNGYNKAIDSSLIDLTCCNQIEAVMSEDKKPNKKKILSDLNQLEKILSGVIEERDEEVEMLPVGPDIYPVASISRRASELL